MGYESEEKKEALNPENKQNRLDRIWERQEGLEPGSANQSKQERLERILEQQEQLESDRAIYQAGQEREEEEKRNQPQKPEKMDSVLFAILLLLCVIGDLIDILTVGTIGWIVGLFIDGILLLATGLSKAGRKQFKRILVGVLGETIPIPLLAIVPFRSLFLTWGFIKSRSSTVQKMSSHLNKVSPAANKVI